MTFQLAAGHKFSCAATSAWHVPACLMNTWARSVKAGTMIAMPNVFADDAGVLSNKSEDVDVA